MASRPKLSADERRERRIARDAALAKLKRERHRYYISLNCKGSFEGYGKFGQRVYRKYAWPKLFHTEDEAWHFAHQMDPFKNSDAIPGRGRVVSYTVQFKLLPEP